MSFLRGTPVQPVRYESRITVDLNRKVRNMKPVHGGGQPPVISTARDTYFHYLTEAGIPYSRLHDVGGAFGNGKYVDIPNIFRNFDADENDPASYDFTFTDVLINSLVKAKVEPYFRLGVTIENAYPIKAYWVVPPRDNEKWARICEHIIRHYTEGWADGFHHKITYWEIWGEPDGCIWQGEDEAYFELYHVAASHLKKCFPHLKIGGYGSCGFELAVGEKRRRTTLPPERFVHYIDFFHRFLQYIKERGTPFDFFSWHCYQDSVIAGKVDAWIHEQLLSYGYDKTESHLNEWDPYCEEFGTAHHSAELAAMLTTMQNGYADVCCIYDMRITSAPYCPFFNPATLKPVHGYYTFVAFNKLYQLGTQVEVCCDTEGLHVLAASNGENHAMLIANLTENTQHLSFEGVDLSRARYYVIDQERLLSWAPNANAIAKHAVYLIEW